MTERGTIVHAPTNLDGLRAGRTVMFGAHYYQVHRICLTEKMLRSRFFDEPDMVGATELDLQLLLIEQSIRLPEGVVAIPVPDATSNSIVVDGCAYGVAQYGTEKVRANRPPPCGDAADMVRIGLVRLQSNDPKGSTP